MSIARSLPIVLAVVSLSLAACGPGATGGNDAGTGTVDTGGDQPDGVGGTDTGGAVDAVVPPDTDPGAGSDGGAAGDAGPSSDVPDVDVDAGGDVAPADSVQLDAEPADVGPPPTDLDDDSGLGDGGGDTLADGAAADAEPGDGSIPDDSGAPDGDTGPEEEVFVPEGPPDVADECDKDQDKVLATICGGTDCLDYNPDAYPGAPNPAEPSCNTAASWSTEIIPGSEDETSRYTRVSVDWAGDIHVTWYSVADKRLMYATDRSGVWITQVIDDEGDSGWYSSSAVDDLGFVHISYHDKGGGLLKYATDASGDWEIEVLDGPAPNVGTFTSLAVDQTGRPHIAYHDGQAGLLRYARLEADGWQIQDVASQGLLRPHISLAVTAKGAPSILFRDDAQDAINRVYGINGFWKLETLNAGEAMGYFPSHALLANGGYRAAFFQCIQFVGQACWLTNLVLAVQDPGKDLAIGPIVQELSEFTQLGVVVDGSVKTHLVYPNNGLAYGWVGPLGGVPASYDIDPQTLAPGEQVSIAAGEDGRLVVAWRDDKADAIRVGRSQVCAGIDQSCTGVDSWDTDQDGFVDSAFGGPDCNDTEAWIKPGAPDAEAADCSDPSSYQALSVGVNGGAGWDDDPSFAIGPGGTGHVAAYDKNGRLILYSHPLDAATWTPLTLDASAGVGPGTAIAADRDGGVHVVYRHGASNGLRYATNATGTWGLQLIPSNGGSPGFDPALALDSDGKAHVAHYNSGTQALGYATNRSGVWASLQLDTGFPAGRNPSIAIHPLGDVWILYHWSSPVDADLRIATNASGAFETFPISATDKVPQGLGLRIDRAGVVHALYMQGASLEHGALSTVDGTWTFETAWTNPSGNPVMGQFSVVLDDVDRLWVAVGDESDGLWLLHRRPNGWESKKIHDGLGLQADVAIDLMGNVQVVGKSSSFPVEDSLLGWMYGTSCAIADHDCDGFDL